MLICSYMLKFIERQMIMWWSSVPRNINKYWKHWRTCMSNNNTAWKTLNINSPIQPPQNRPASIPLSFHQHFVMLFSSDSPLPPVQYSQTTSNNVYPLNFLDFLYTFPTYLRSFLTHFILITLFMFLKGTTYTPVW